MIDKIVTRSQELKRLYEDTDGSLMEEVKNARTSGIEQFYSAVNAAKEYYATFPSANSAPADDTSVDVNVAFSGEEVFGKYLDLNPLHLEFSNVIRKANIEQDYLQYLERFNTFFYLPEIVRNSRQYSEYLEHLWQYLVDFFRRTNPLTDWTKIEEEIKAGFSSAASGAPSAEGKDGAGRAGGAQPLRLGMFNSEEELQALGMERLKEGLVALGLKCGGTLQDRAARLWSVRGKRPEDIPAALRSKDSGKQKNEGGDGSDKFSSVSLWIMIDMCSHPPLHLIVAADLSGVICFFVLKVKFKEHRVQALCDLMSAVVSTTVKHAEKQQTRTAEEREQELREEEFGLLPEVGSSAKKAGAGEGDDEDAPIYNPLNLPLGWDGKPIPYWMYKLHGLGVEYKCQICGDQSYWGRRAFDRHFQEWKHAYGMRCLGIPNTKHFHDITQIDDAVALYAKIKAEISVGQFQGDQEEEFEDTHGNVLNRRTYEDLARQGLL